MPVTRRPFPRSFRHPTAALLLLASATAACTLRPVPREAEATPLVGAVTTVGMTVAAVDRSVDFYSRVLAFTVVSDVEVAGADVERLQGVFGIRMRDGRPT
jgi:hypothetical protein